MPTDATISIKLPPLAFYQHEALYARARWVVTEGSTKCGKTYPCLIWLLDQAITLGKPNRAFWWVAPVFTQADIAFRRMETEILRRADPSGRIWKVDKVKRCITLANGGMIWFKSADNADSLYGEDVYAAVFDEASRAGRDAWTAVRSTLTATGGQCRIIGNVRGRKNWAYELARKAQGGEANMHYAKMTADMAVKAGIFPESELDDARAMLPEQVFRELYYCEPSDDGANPFGLSHIAACVGPLSNREPVAFGVDLARAIDWTVVIGLDEDCRVCVSERWQGESWDMTERKLTDLIQNRPTFADSSGVGDPIVERLSREMNQVEAFPTGVATRKQGIIEGLAVDIQKHAVMFPDGPIRAELECFEYQLTSTQRVRYSAPDGMHDDCVVALGLAVAKWHSRNQNRPGVAFTHERSLRSSVGTFTNKRTDAEWAWNGN